jgi:uncharacterized RDD family membrane protein YckC
MTRFCPYCGKQLSERSKFCSQCGKAPPARRRQSQVALDDDPAKPVGSNSNDAATGSRSLGDYSTISEQASIPEQASRPNADARAGLRTTVTGPRAGNGSGVVRAGVERRYAPKSHSLADYGESAGFGLRYGAWMFDFLITLIAIMFFTFILTAVSRQSVVGSNRDLIIVAALTLLLFVFNFVVLAGSNGQSAGMRILGIYIVRVDGRPFTIKDAAMRHLVGYPLSTVAFFLGFLWMLWDPRQQGWHDKLAGTVVVMSK